jgi:hypothetical protein
MPALVSGPHLIEPEILVEERRHEPSNRIRFFRFVNDYEPLSSPGLCSTVVREPGVTQFDQHGDHIGNVRCSRGIHTTFGTWTTTASRRGHAIVLPRGWLSEADQRFRD